VEGWPFPGRRATGDSCPSRRFETGGRRHTAPSHAGSRSTALRGMSGPIGKDAWVFRSARPCPVARAE
jgi:hypothetical protein